MEADAWTKDQLVYLKTELERLSAALYGDSREKINGGGLYGEVRRIRQALESYIVEQRRLFDEQTRALIEVKVGIEAQRVTEDEKKALAGILKANSEALNSLRSSIEATATITALERKLSQMEKQIDKRQAQP